MNNIFNMTKLKPLIKFRGYQYIGVHSSDATNYYIRKYDNHNNYEFMEAKIERTNGLCRKYMLASGTSIKILDPFMYSYLKHRKDKDLDTLLTNGFVKMSLAENGFNKNLKQYSNKVPKEIMGTDYYKKAIKDGFKVLYVMNTESDKVKFATVSLVFVKEFHQSLLDTDLSYVLFKMAEFAVKPSFVKGESKEKYSMFELPGLNIPVDILK